MPLTPEDVSNKRFTPVRLREGYDMGEVDQFLDEIETELTRLISENEKLRSQLSSAQHHGSADEPAEREEAVEAPAPAAPAETIKVHTVAEASSAAVRLLEIATRNADELVTEAKNDAEQIVGEALAEAERRESESKRKTDQLESEARSRSKMLDSETTERRTQLFGDLDRERERMDGEVESLRAFEREYRSRLKGYFQQQLEALDGDGEGGALHSSDPQPGRLRSLLGDEEESRPHQ
jgi:DivIVA domain-containing protein